MRIATYALLSALVMCLVACTKVPDPEYRLPAAYLAWQPYQVGQTMRFGNSNTAAVRTYSISQVDDRMETRNQGGGINLFPVGSVKEQWIDVMVTRTDSVSTYGAVNLLHLSAARPSTATGAYVSWDFSFSHELPLDAFLANWILSDTTATLLPQLQLGSQTYSRVARLSRSSYGATPVGARTIQRIFYAEQVGLVGFVEGRMLWYRLP